MLRGIRWIGSLAFVLGLFVVVFVAIPWIVTVVDDPTIGGPLPWWVKGAIYLVLGGVAVVLVTVAIEQRPGKAGEAEPDVAAGPAGILMGNTDRVPGREVTEALGLVRGHTIYAIWLGKDISALVRLILGGELREYTEMMGKAREVALQRMLEQAADLGADAVVNVRFMTASVIGSAAELLAYGTAVRLAP
ncbi:MAG: YbjQ family protein, partial [Planctomycetota bacterium]